MKGLNIKMKEIILMICSALAILALLIGAWILSAHYEAKAFYNATGKKVSTWDALFIELRVQEQINHDK